jgi:hypothetical protein
MSIASLAVLALLSSPATQEGASPEARAVDVVAHEALNEELAGLAGAHPELATLFRVGVSREGRPIEALRLTAASDPAEHPAILLVANLEGPRVFESGVALHHAAELAAGHADDDRVRALLESTVVWVIPRANPDAAEARFEQPTHERWASSSGVDNDRDGRSGEDGPTDVDGDGLVTWMRVLDPEGTLREDPIDGRVLVEAERDKGEVGRWKLHVESRDLDGDEEPGEDAPGDTRVDRNFPAGWEAHGEHSGVFPTDEPEVRALCEFVMARKNLVLVVSYDGLDNLVGEPESVKDDAPSVKRIPPEGVLESDAGLLAELGRRYREVTGNDTKSDAPDEGTFARWCYDHRGLTVLSAVLWDLPTEAPEPEEDVADEEEPAQAEEPAGDEPEPDQLDQAGEEEDAAEPSQDAKHLRWVDGAGESWRFVDWKPFDHPELGPVEIGGFAPYARLEPPRDAWDDLAGRHFEWFVGLGELLPRVMLAECTREEVGDGVWRVEAVLENDAFLPLLSRSARRTRTTRPARVTLHLPEGATLLAGDPQGLVRDLPGSGGRATFTWLVHGPGGAEVGVSVDTDHAGEVYAAAEVKQ